jgi:PA14 domain/Peptidase_C39 like family
MADTLIAVAMPVNSVFVAIAGKLPAIFAVSGDNITLALTVDPSEYNLNPADVVVGANLSNDDTQVVYTLNDSTLGSPVIKSALLNGTKPPQLLAKATEKERFSTPVLSPDGSQIAYIKNTELSDGSIAGEVYLMVSDGSANNRVYGDTATQLLGWSGDGKKLYLTTRSANEAENGTAFAVLTIKTGKAKTIDLDTAAGNAKNLHPLNFQLATAGKSSRLVYTLHKSPYLQGNEPGAIKVLDADSGNTLITAQLGDAASDILISPDLSKIVYAMRDFREVEGGSELVGSGVAMVTLNGSREVLSVQKGVEYYNALAWTGDYNGFFLKDNNGNVTRVTLSGKQFPVIIQEIPAEDLLHLGDDDSLAVPLIRQVDDTPKWFNGNWACNATSAVMVLAAYGLLDAHPEGFGWYVAGEFKSKTSGHVFNRAQNDPSGKPAKGGYGHCTEGGEGYAWRIADFMTKNGLNSKANTSISPQRAAQLVREGKPVVMGGTIKGWGHICVIKGVTPDGRFKVNDPYWTKHGAGDTIYSWAEMRPIYIIEVDRPLSTGATIAAVQTKVAPEPVVPPIVGEGLEDTKRRRFEEAYIRNGGREKLGVPAAKPFNYNSRWLQDFPNGTLMALDDRHDNLNAITTPTIQPAFVIRDPILKVYKEQWGGSAGSLGSITGDEFINVHGQRQVNFEGGFITYDGTNTPTAFPYPTSFNGFKAEYFNNTGLAGAPAYVRDEPAINYEWADKAPDEGKIGILPNGYSVRWTKKENFAESGTYAFTVTVDDGFRLIIDGKNLAQDGPDQYWIRSAPMTYTLRTPLDAGEHEIKLEYLEISEGAVIKFSWLKE